MMYIIHDKNLSNASTDDAWPQVGNGETSVTEIASHRGGALLWPENSRTAFESTTRLKVDQVEFDVHPSRDGELVVIHDPTLDRTTNGTGPVHGQSFSELSKLTLRGTAADRILLFDEVIDIFEPTLIKLRIELKKGADALPYPGLPDKVMETLDRRGMLDRSIVTSFELDVVCAAAACAPVSGHVYLILPELEKRIGLDAVLQTASGRGIPMLALRESTLDAAKISRIRSAGLGVGAWAVNELHAIDRMLELGVDVFTTDRPDLALERAGKAKPNGRNVAG